MFRNTFSSVDNQILCDASIDYYIDLQRRGVDIGLRKTGYLWLMSARQMSSSQDSFEKMTRNNIEIRLYDKREIEKTIPELKTTLQGGEELRSCNWRILMAPRLVQSVEGWIQTSSQIITSTSFRSSVVALLSTRLRIV